MTALYNEIDGYASQWLRNLITAGHIADGVVDERSIVELTADDVAGPGQRHFFAGIGGWSCALRLAGVPDDADVWTASCPCQPLSAAGRQRGFGDERHLWPILFELVRACRPPLLLGEQVSSRLGLEWLDLVCADLEGAGYTVRAADTCAASVGAPHIRQRIYFVADSASNGRHARIDEREAQGDRPRPANDCRSVRVGHSDRDTGWRDGGTVPREEAEAWRSMRSGTDGSRAAGADLYPWSSAEWLSCSDGKQRPTQPGIRVLADGLSAGVGRNRAKRLKGYGNAIVPQQAAAFIRAALTPPTTTATTVEQGALR